MCLRHGCHCINSTTLQLYPVQRESDEKDRTERVQKRFSDQGEEERVNLFRKRRRDLGVSCIGFRFVGTGGSADVETKDADLKVF
ncbi:hypothetical protein TNCV_3554101 [Trichonephila clavipes]|nr:hypothetical protein TNCV_3554101 [Trichonephila clavipes]